MTEPTDKEDEMGLHNWFDCATCGESFDPDEYQIEVDDAGEYATFCSWDCLVQYPPLRASDPIFCWVVMQSARRIRRGRDDA
jgi:hypothetical protein